MSPSSSRSPKDVQSVVLSRRLGTQVAISYTDTSGASQTATVTLGSGPPQ